MARTHRGVLAFWFACAAAACSAGAPGDAGTDAPAPDVRADARALPDRAAPPDVSGGDTDAADSPAEDADAPADDAPAVAVDAASPDGDAASGDAASGDAAATANLRIAVISDLNESYGSTTYSATVHGAVRALTGTIRPDLVLVTGDMVAGQQSGLDYAAMWRGFHAAVTTPLRAAGIPLAVTPGNHDASAYPAYAGERRIFAEQWTAAARVPPVAFVDRARYPLRYSFVHRGAFFLALDATAPGALSAEQRAWVGAQLAAAQRYPVRIAFGHLPLHPVAVGRETEVLADAELEALFRRHGLTAYLSGHQHGYYPGARGGVRLVSMACAGAGPRALIGTSAPSPRSLLQIDVRDGRVTALDALLAPEFTRRVERRTLPAELRYGSQRVARDDLAGF